MVTIRTFSIKTGLARRIVKGLFALLISLAVLSCRVSSAAQKTQAHNAPIMLSLSDAINDALHNNVLVKLAREHIEEVKAIREQSRSELLPHLSANGSQSRTFWYNAAEEGLPETGILGPFNSFDARFQIIQRVFDLGAFAGFQGENVGLKIARLKEGFSKQQVILAAVFAYLNVLDNKEKLKAVDEDISLAQQLEKTAEHQLAAGVVTELDVVRAKTHLAQREAYRQDILESLHTAYFQLMRTTGMPLDSHVRLSDSLNFFNQKTLTVTDAIDTAFQDRIEMSLAEEQVHYREYKLSQAKKERLPVISAYGDYGRGGATPQDYAHEVSEVGVKFSMPIFDGGDISGRIREQNSLKHSEELKKDDMQVQVEQDVRLALQTLSTSTDRVKAAKEAFDLAKRELELAQNQYHAGMENNIAVVEAQAVLEHAHEVYITDIMLYHLARVNYFSALGDAGKFYLNP